MIELKTKLGNVALSIVAEPKADQLGLLAALALQSLVFHKAPGSAFKKGSGLTRKDAYSEKLRDGVVGAVKTAMATLFDSVVVEGGEHIATLKVDAALVEREKIWKSLEGVLDEEKRAEMFPEFYGDNVVAEVVEEETAE